MKENTIPPDSGSSDDNHQTLEAAHRDIAFGNNYRIEYIKHLVSIGAGVFIFSVTFMKDFVGRPTAEAQGRPLLLLGWCFLVLSILSGIFHMRYWALYYISWGTEWTTPEAKRWRQIVNRHRKLAETTQIYGFLVGLVLLLAFAAWNLFVPNPR